MAAFSLAAAFVSLSFAFSADDFDVSEAFLDSSSIAWASITTPSTSETLNSSLIESGVTTDGRNFPSSGLQNRQIRPDVVDRVRRLVQFRIQGGMIRFPAAVQGEILFPVIGRRLSHTSPPELVQTTPGRSVTTMTRRKDLLPSGRRRCIGTTHIPGRGGRFFG